MNILERWRAWRWRRHVARFEAECRAAGLVQVRLPDHVQRDKDGHVVGTFTNNVAWVPPDHEIARPRFCEGITERNEWSE